MARVARGIRRLGSAALDLAFVAAGHLDGFWELHLSPWDVAAGAAIVRAAGGTVTDVRGGDDWLHGRHIVASNGLLHEALRRYLPAAEGDLPDGFTRDEAGSLPAGTPAPRDRGGRRPLFDARGSRSAASSAAAPSRAYVRAAKRGTLDPFRTRLPVEIPTEPASGGLCPSGPNSR